MTLTSIASSRRAVAALTVGLLALTSCGSGDSSTEGNDAVSVEEFCTQLGDVASQDNVDSEALQALDDLAVVAPAEISEEMTTLAAVFAELTAATADTSPDADLSAMEEGIAKYNVVAAQLDTWTNANCPDLPENLFTQGG